VMAIGRMMGREPERSLAVCLGVEIQPANEKLIGFLNDPGLKESPLVPRPVVAEREERSKQIKQAMERLLAEELKKPL